MELRIRESGKQIYRGSREGGTYEGTKKEARNKEVSWSYLRREREADAQVGGA